MRIVCLGDSLTAGYGVSKNASWVSLLKHKLNHDIINEGVNGDTSFGLLTRSFKDVIDLNPDICIILIGTNDLLMGRSLENTFDNIKTLVHELKENKISPIIAFPPRIVPYLAKENWCDTIDYLKVNNELLKPKGLLLTLCEDGSYKSLDFYDAFYSLGEDNSYKFYLDGIHLNDKGHEIMYNMVIKEIMEWIL